MSQEVSKEDFKKWRSSDWSITINNPTAQDTEQIQQLSTHKWYKSFVNQHEVGEEGTPHIQGHLKTEYIRFSAVKKALTRAHIEVAKNRLALANYAKKDDDTYQSEGIVVQNCSIATVHKTVASYFNSYDECLKEWEKQEDYEDYALSQLDKATRLLIRAGVFGVEFIGANPQTRCVYKKYYLSLMYRQYNASQASSQPREEEERGSSPEGDGEDASNVSPN